jgi:hypothetical protein
LSVNFDGGDMFWPFELDHTTNFFAGLSFKSHYHRTSTDPLSSIWLTDWLLCCMFCVTPAASAFSYKNVTCLINTELLVGEPLLLNMLCECKRNEVMSHSFTYSTPLKK